MGKQSHKQNNPADDDINTATAIVENITKFREGSVEIIEVEINPETTVGTFVTGQTLTGTSNINEEVTVKIDYKFRRSLILQLQMTEAH